MVFMVLKECELLIFFEWNIYLLYEDNINVLENKNEMVFKKRYLFIVKILFYGRVVSLFLSTSGL